MYYSSNMRPGAKKRVNEQPAFMSTENSCFMMNTVLSSPNRLPRHDGVPDAIHHLVDLLSGVLVANQLDVDVLELLQLLFHIQQERNAKKHSKQRERRREK